MKVRVQANRLEKGDVAYISLVERGANRAPFKVMKQDKGQTMIDLSRILKGDSQAKIVGYVLKSEDRTDAVDAALKGLGIIIDKPVEFTDGTMIFKQEEFDPKDAKGVVAIKMDESFVVLAKGFDPYSMCEDMGFSDILKSQGFMPGLSMAMDALGTTVRQSLVAADNPADAVSKVEEALDQFHDYAAKLVASIPATAFKALESFRKTKAEDVKLASELATDEDKKLFAALKTSKEKSAFLRTTKEERAKVAKAASDKDTAAAADAEKALVAKAEGELAGEDKDFYTKLAAGEKPAFLKMTPEQRKAAMKAKKDEADKVAGGDTVAIVSAAMEKATTTILGKVSEMLGGVQKTLGEKVDAATAVAKDAKDTAEKVQKATRGMVIGDASDDAAAAEAAAALARKSDTGRSIDTAFDRSVRKVEHNSGRHVRRQRTSL